MLLTMCVGLNAQTFYGSRYKGYFDLNIGPGNDGVYKGTNALSFGLLNSHGYQFSPYIYVGAGFGIDYHHTENFDNAISIPVFSNIRFNFQDSNTSPYLDLKVGYSFLLLSGKNIKLLKDRAELLILKFSPFWLSLSLHT